MKWSGEQYKCRNCGEVYPYSLSRCPCGGICEKIADASQSSSKAQDPDRSILSRILKTVKQKEQDNIKNELARLYNAVDEACSKDEYSIAIEHLENILEITPDSKDAKDLLDFCKKKTSQIEKQFSRGWNYYHGEGVQQNYAEAVKWFTKAAEQGHAGAQINLGLCYERGHGVPQDYTEAVKWYRKAAEQGEKYGQYNLGVCYYNGVGVPQDYTEAVKWYRKAAEQRYADAQNWLGECYYYGNGVSQDYTEAVKWYRKAAEQGYASAQYNLAFCYENGEGIPRNLAEAQKWYRKAADQCHADAKKSLDRLNGK